MSSTDKRPEEMTLDECRAWLAERAGWYGIGRPPLWCNRVTHEETPAHPIPPTLDAAAAAMP